MRILSSVLLFAAFYMTPHLCAQFDTATVLGTVRDPGGLPIANGKVELQNLGTGIRQSTNTDEQGNYQFNTVKAGNYKVTAQSEGFKQALADNVTVNVNARQRVDLRLEIGVTTETVTIGAQVATLETESSSRGTVISTAQVVNLPLNGRAYADLALLAPGVRRSAISNSRDSSFNVNGMRSSQNNFIIDGVDNNSYGTSNQGFSNQVVQITPDAVQEFRLETNNFSAEFGRAGGGVVNATIRSGTNAFHGSAWEYLRNTSLNATGFFKPTQNRKPVLIQNQFGAAAGGPIKKEKMFFFADYEGYRRVQKVVQFASLPTMDQRQGILGSPVMNPYTGARYMDGIVPSNEISAVAKAVLADLPAPNRPGLANNFQYEPASTFNTDKGDVRYDQYFSSKLQGFARYSHRLMNNFEAPNIPGPSGGNANGTVRVLNWQVAFGTTYTLSPTSLIEFRMGISKTEGGKFPIFVGTQTVGDRFGIPNIPNDKRFTGGIPALSVNGYSQFGVQSSNPQFQNPSVVNPKFNYTKIIGRHSLKAGYEYQAVNTQIDDFNPKYGSSTYAGRFSQIPGTPANDVQFLTDFFFGARSNYQLNNAVIVDYRQRMHFLYLQDDFKVSRKLTLNLGLRYEYATPQWEDQNRLGNFDPVTQTMVVAKDGGVFDRATVKPDKNNFAPRAGLAYSLTPKTVIRSAYGVSYVAFNRMGGENLLAYNLPFILNPQVDQLAPTVANSGQPLCTSTAQGPFTCFRPFQQGNPDNFLSLANIRPLGVRTNQIPFDLPTAYTQSWHFSIQRELAKEFVLDIGYNGVHSVGLMILGDLNQARPNNVGENLTLQARRPIQTFGFIQSAFNGGFLRYNALQAKVERRFSGGVYFLNSFTWSKGMDNASGHLEANNGDNSRVNYRDLRSEVGPSGYDQKLVNVTTLLYELPVGKGRKFGSNWHPVAGHALGGWRLSAINFLYSGPPVNLTYSPSSQFQVSSAPNYRPNVLGDPLAPESERRAERWLNTANVVIPTDPSRPFGNAGRNNVRGPGLAQLNFGLHKDFNFTESMKLEFRTEAFNLFNRTNFATPNSNRSSSAFGTITALSQPAREIQFALRFVF